MSVLVPGVFIGAFLAAWLTGELKLQGFEGGGSMRRYLAGAALMGFGGMLAAAARLARASPGQHFRADRLGNAVSRSGSRRPSPTGSSTASWRARLFHHNPGRQPRHPRQRASARNMKDRQAKHCPYIRDERRAASALSKRLFERRYDPLWIWVAYACPCQFRNRREGSPPFH
jgi:hypothetical protein